MINVDNFLTLSELLNNDANTIDDLREIHSLFVDACLKIHAESQLKTRMALYIRFEEDTLFNSFSSDALVNFSTYLKSILGSNESNTIIPHEEGTMCIRKNLGNIISLAPGNLFLK